MKANLTQENLTLLYRLADGQPYQSASYTSIKDFTPSLPKLNEIREKLALESPRIQPDWIPEDPYPRIYTKHYKKTILTSL